MKTQTKTRKLNKSYYFQDRTSNSGFKSNNLGQLVEMISQKYGLELNADIVRENMTNGILEFKIITPEDIYYVKVSEVLKVNFTGEKTFKQKVESRELLFATL